MKGILKIRPSRKNKDGGCLRVSVLLEHVCNQGKTPLLPSSSTSWDASSAFEMSPLPSVERFDWMAPNSVSTCLWFHFNTNIHEMDAADKLIFQYSVSSTARFIYNLQNPQVQCHIHKGSPITPILVRINLLFYLFFHRRPIPLLRVSKHTTVEWDDGGKIGKIIN